MSTSGVGWRATGVVGVLVLLAWALITGMSTPSTPPAPPAPVASVGGDGPPPSVVTDRASATDPSATDPASALPALPPITATASDPLTPTGPVPVTASAADERARRAIAYALAQRGLPYVWGGDGPAAGEAGFDCSGLTKAAYGAAGVALPRTAQTQYDAGPHVVDATTPAPGDLVFYGTPTAVHHVALFLGRGLMVQAPYPGTVVQVSPYRWAGDDYLGATRPAAPTGAVSPTDLAPEGPAVTPLEPRVVVRAVPAPTRAPTTPATTPRAPSRPPTGPSTTSPRPPTGTSTTSPRPLPPARSPGPVG